MVRLARLKGVARKIPGARWILKRFLVTASPARMFERLVNSGVPILVVAGHEEARRLSQGEERRIRTLTRSGAFRMEVVPGLEHTLLERTGRDYVSEILHAWIFGTGDDNAAHFRPDAGSQKSTGQFASAETDPVRS
jgi:hypothetical protein